MVAPPSHRHWPTVIALAVFTAHVIALPAIFIDDTFIFYRYASNAAAGHGLVYNLGERVEGYSSLLWTLLLALGARLGMPLVGLGPALALVCAAGALLVTAGLGRLLLPQHPRVADVVAIAMALSSGLARFTAAGMESALFTLCLAGAIVTVEHARRTGAIGLACLSLAALVLARAEGMLYAIGLLALLLANRARARALARADAVLVLVVGAVVSIQLAGRWLFYGDLVPATVRAKAYAVFLLREALHHVPGAARRLYGHLRLGIRYALPAVALLVPAALAGMLRIVRRRPIEPVVIATMGCVTLGIAVAVAAGGDWMPHHRFLVPIWGLSLGLAAWGASGLLEGLRVAPRPAAFAAGVVALAGGLLGYAGTFSVARLTRPVVFAVPPIARPLVEVGRFLASAEPAPVVVASLAGALPFYAGSRVHVRDALGLTDAHNAQLGAVWVRTYGRTDPTYTFGPPLDLLETYTARDLMRLLEINHGEREFVVFTRPDWIGRRFFLVARADHPVTAAIRRAFGSGVLPLDSTVVTRLRAVELSQLH